jgi:probable F420-dependent oxidoreductase
MTSAHLQEDDQLPRVGAIVPNEGPLPLELGLAAIGRAAEAAGADGLWVSDHLLMVDRDHADYPYSDDGRMTWPVDTAYLQTFVCCTTLAAATERCRIGTAVLILPQRPVLEVAKVAATLDQVSGGRLALGVGVGWNRAEMEALGFSAATRGRRMDEMLEVLRSAWSGRPAAFDGREVRIPPDVVLSPTPRQGGGVPLIVGGLGDAALRRAASRGDGWMAIAFAHKWDADALRRRISDLQEIRAAQPGADRPFEMVLKLHAGPDDAHRLPTLASEAVTLGFDEVIVDPPWRRGLKQGAEIVAATVTAIRG